MVKKIVLATLCLGLTGCGLFKSERMAIPEPPPRLNSDEREAISQQAQLNYELAKMISEKGAKPGEEITILLKNGSKVILKYTGVPIRDVTTDPRSAKRIINEANNVAEDFGQANSEYTDDMYNNRERLINKTNLYWDWKKILGGGIITWVLVAIAVPILCAFFPVIIPFVQIAWQVLKAGIGAIKIMANLGLSGLTNMFKAIEKFRDEHKGTEIGEKFDKHMKNAVPDKDKVAFDQFKNYFDI